MAKQSPAPVAVSAELQALTALVLDRARSDPQRRPGEHLVGWHRRLARRLSVVPRHPRTNRELLDGVLRLHGLQSDPGARTDVDVAMADLDEAPRDEARWAS